MKLGERTILHSDMNCFYASVEMMLDPSLRGKAVAVCGSTENRHGIVLAKSELAKRAGVKTGMVNWEARQCCPNLIMVKPQYEQYLKYSELARNIYQRYSAPSFSKYISQRCNSAGTAADNGTYIKSTVNFSYASCSSKNTITTATYYKKTTDTSWTNANKTFTSGTAFTFGGGNISAESSYEVKFTLKDAFATIEVTDTLSTASVVMDFKSGGLGVAVGKVSETDRCFEVSDAWDVKVYGMLLSAYIQSLMTGGGLDFATCSTAAGTAAKVAACTGFKLETGAAVLVKFANANSSASPTLNVNSTGAKNIVTYGTTAIGTYYWKAGQVVLFLYDGTSWQAVNMSTATTSYYAAHLGLPVPEKIKVVLEQLHNRAEDKEDE